jgi:endonuclease/exonuclease/phosphatase family metal-dependent hydrolase
MGGLRILTYNTQCRSWGMEAGAQGTLTPVTSVEERAALISKRILDGAQQYDIVCLNEVFDEDARDVFEDKLRPSYPAGVRKADAGSPATGFLTLAAAAGVEIVVPVWGWLGAIGLSALAIDNLTSWEDSGLMLFSRLPFDDFPTPSGFEELGSTSPAAVYLPYADHEGGDSYAAKGVIYGRFVFEGGRKLHLLMSHTQADSSTDIGGHRDVRRKQFAQVWNLLDSMAGPAPIKQEVIFCGDLNVNGLDTGAGRPEWQTLFDTPTSHFTKDLFDPWFHEQRARDPNNPGRPLPIEDPGATTHVQRLDYMLRTRPVGGFDERLATQHMALAFDVAQASGAADPNTYTSDHVPLRIDLNWERDHNTVWTAQTLNPLPDVRESGALQEGEMHWYRIDSPGGYGIGIVAGAPGVAAEVYTADNFSVPVPPFTTTAESPGNDLPPVTRFALPEAPFFIRVFPRKRTGKHGFELLVHRYEGRGLADAIPLIHGTPDRFQVQTDAPHSLALPGAPFDSHDSVWFVTRFDEPPPSRPSVTTTVKVADMHDTASFGVIVAQKDDSGQWEQLGEAGAGSDPLDLSVEQKRRGRGYVLVKRHDPSFQAWSFGVEVTSDLSYMYGLAADPDAPGLPDRQGLQEAYVFCEDETDNVLGFIPVVNELGSDDIALNIDSEGENLLHIPNSDAFEFDDDTKRALNFSFVRYGGDAKVELVELDALSAADRAAVVVPQFTKALTVADKVIQRTQCAAFVVYRIDFEDDDGRYFVGLTVSCEPPPVP